MSLELGSSKGFFLWEDEMAMEDGRCKCGKLSLVFHFYDI